MSKMGINWEANLLPNKNLDISEKYPYAKITQKLAYGFPVIEAEKDTIAKIVS